MMEMEESMEKARCWRRSCDDVDDGGGDDGWGSCHPPQLPPGVA